MALRLRCALQRLRTALPVAVRSLTPSPHANVNPTRTTTPYFFYDPVFFICGACTGSEPAGERTLRLLLPLF